MQARSPWIVVMQHDAASRGIRHDVVDAVDAI
jgi:hypothetical protein